MKQRKDVDQLPSNDKTLALYSRAVAEMKTRPATDPTSWYYQAAMHGFQASNSFWQDVGTLPSQRDQSMYWNQCQHASWYFMPWHRMYIAYFEQIVAQTLVDLGEIANIDDWALPFWNYSNTENLSARTMPHAFTEPAMASNNLWIDGRVHTKLEEEYVELKKLNIIPFTNEGLITGFAGGEDGPIQFGSYTGGLEDLPHNFVHDDINGAMGNPLTAALDPIFWLHHANIDRLWQVWLDMGQGRENSTDPTWLGQSFPFHNAFSQEVEMKVSQVIDTEDVLTGYTYQDSYSPVPTRSVRRKISSTEVLELAAASSPVHSLGITEKVIPLALPERISARHQKTLTALSSELDSATQAYLYLENITGKGVAPIYKVYVNTPSTSTGTQEYFLGKISLFGIETASTPSAHHSGGGLNVSLDISDIFDQLRTKPDWDPAKLSVRLAPTRAVPAQADVKVGRISLHC